MASSALRKWILSTPPVEWGINQLEEVMIGALKHGPLPRHVAFEMDGNRRYARTRKIETVEGHNMGFEAMASILEVCYRCGINAVTVYAFSIENFNRSKFEVDALMDLAKLKLTQMTQHGELLERYGARLRIVGARHLIRADVLEVMEKAEEMTRYNGDAILNMCFPYTSRDEITTAIKTTVEDFSRPVSTHSRFPQARISQKIQSIQGDDASGASDAEDSISSSATLHHEESVFPDPETITSDTLNERMYVTDDPPLDLLIRTSGVRRLSDFMLWQSHQKTDLVFLDCFWPDFDLWRFVPVLVEWQWRRKHSA